MPDWRVSSLKIEQFREQQIQMHLKPITLVFQFQGGNIIEHTPVPSANCIAKAVELLFTETKEALL
jgi:hypothetical protein